MPLTAKGEEIMHAMKQNYGSEKKAKEVFYASKNKGTITGVDHMSRTSDAGAFLDALIRSHDQPAPPKPDDLMGKMDIHGLGGWQQARAFRRGVNDALRWGASTSDAIGNGLAVKQAAALAHGGDFFTQIRKGVSDGLPAHRILDQALNGRRR